MTGFPHVSLFTSRIHQSRPDTRDVVLYCFVFLPTQPPTLGDFALCHRVAKRFIGHLFSRSNKSKITQKKILTRCQFCLLTILSKTRHATQNSVYLIFSLSQGSVAKNIHRRTSTCHTFCLLRSLLPNTVTSSDAISSSNSPYFLRLMRFPILVDMHGNLHDRLARAVQSKDSTYP